MVRQLQAVFVRVRDVAHLFIGDAGHVVQTVYQISGPVGRWVGLCNRVVVLAERAQRLSDLVGQVALIMIKNARVNSLWSDALSVSVKVSSDAYDDSLLSSIVASPVTGT